jgi:hypothetical protein
VATLIIAPTVNILSSFLSFFIDTRGLGVMYYCTLLQ